MAGVVPGVDLSPIIDRQKIGAFHVKLIAIAFLVVMADGYDIGAAAFAAPALIREWHVAPEALGGMFSAGLFAGFFGPLILGWISDHYGKRSCFLRPVYASVCARSEFGNSDRVALHRRGWHFRRPANHNCTRQRILAAPRAGDALCTDVPQTRGPRGHGSIRWQHTTIVGNSPASRKINTATSLQ